ncbi:Uncharacterised protein (plasmid) [Mesomycoplasma conjunctivae]|uniref:Uncharacterized protein n=1 Tax=Mycoplasmopsis fermentans (strain M64) TaxID=943945 RepID=A0AB32XC67_MYCFM|nr:Hypothetical Protein MfeM64YM_0672 [Mycoplasmopsis fermentans M64]RMX35132.1 putative membrane protein [Mycoplasmopsis fermentans MF-I1]RMX35187.1 putative membrane protein [Mycoplasmopsis fermentans MF-I2]VEU63860.1 Uncharacterised protein [Mycoplasmopsis fermentans]VEU67149.1 Uncharacterised protein [Mesomycoplasma conjunctivae]
MYYYLYEKTLNYVIFGKKASIFTIFFNFFSNLSIKGKF